MSIDRGDSHFGDAKSWERACRHIGLFLWWAAERGLASELHDPKVVAVDPTGHVISQCDTKLTDEDLSEEGLAFADRRYEAYLKEVSAYAAALGVGVYDVPEGLGTTTHFFAWLDARLAEMRADV